MTGTSWCAPSPGPFQVDISLPEADPMWAWADATGYVDLGLTADMAGRQGLWCVVEPPAAVGTAQPQLWKPADLAQWQKQATPRGRVELTMPVVPQRPRPRPGVDLSAVPSQTATPSQATTLVGVIDSGCPFAARMLQRPDGTGTRLLALWDQDDAPAFAACGGHVPSGFPRGCAMDRAALNQLLARYRNTAGVVDEEACYRAARYDAVSERFSHGAAVLSQLLAPVPRSGRPQERTPMDEADLVFVQLPRAAVQDSTSASLTRQVLDGVRYILAHAGPKTERVVINLSNGTSRGLHDGSGLLEQTLQALVAAAKPTVTLVLAAGNTNLEQRHAVLSLPAGAAASPELVLNLPPACETPQFITVAWPANAPDLCLAVWAPDAGAPEGRIEPGQVRVWPSAQQVHCTVASPGAQAGQARSSLVVFAPTQSDDRARSVPSGGRWRFRVVSTAGPAELAAAGSRQVQFWISRNQQNPGAWLRASQATFADTFGTYAPARCLRLPEDDPPTPIANGPRRLGAWNGLAGGSLTDSLVVVGSHVQGDPGGRPARYSAAGPGPSANAALRRAPDYQAPGDASIGLTGVAVRGNRSGEVLRVVGTSFSAPSVARALVNGTPFDPPQQQRPGRTATKQLEPP